MAVLVTLEKPWFVILTFLCSELVVQEDGEDVVNMETDEEEPEVLDLENPSFDIRSADELPAQEAQTDIVDRLEFEQDSNPPSSRSHTSQCGLLCIFLTKVLYLLFSLSLWDQVLT